jgi:hypothetical protein
MKILIQNDNMKNIKEYNFNGMTVPFIINDYYESETK